MITSAPGHFQRRFRETGPFKRNFRGGFIDGGVTAAYWFGDLAPK